MPTCSITLCTSLPLSTVSRLIRRANRTSASEYTHIHTQQNDQPVSGRHAHVSRRTGRASVVILEALRVHCITKRLKS